MAMMELGGKTLEVDDDGFIQDPSAWDDDVAAALAATDGVTELTPAHWKLVRFVRAFYLEHGKAPEVAVVHHARGLLHRGIRGYGKDLLDHYRAYLYLLKKVVKLVDVEARGLRRDSCLDVAVRDDARELAGLNYGQMFYGVFLA